MHLNFGFTAVQTLWTLTFAGLLVLLVVLMGRDRMRRFPWFTASIVLVALRLLASRLLFGRLAPIPMSAIFITLADVAALLALAVLIEVARQAFTAVKARTWIIGSVALLAVGVTVLATWGPWPAWKTMTGEGTMSLLRFMQLVAQKGDLLVDVLTVCLGVLVVLFGRRYGAGWRSHTQQLLIGLSTASAGQMSAQGIWQRIALTAVPHSQAEYEHIMGLREKIYNANNAVYVAVVLWWIVCLWIEEPWANPAEAAAEAAPAELPSNQ